MKIEIDFEKEDCNTHYTTTDEKTGKKVRVSITEVENLDIDAIVRFFRDQIPKDIPLSGLGEFHSNVREAIKKEVNLITEKREGK